MADITITITEKEREILSSKVEVKALAYFQHFAVGGRFTQGELDEFNDLNLLSHKLRRPGDDRKHKQYTKTDFPDVNWVG